MKFVIANLIVFVGIVLLLLWSIWGLLDVHWRVKVALGLIGLIAAGFFSERLLSKWVNRVVSKL